MASETRRAAQALIETRVERFESRHSLEASKARLAETLARARPEGRVDFTTRWADEDGKPVLEATFAPPRRVGRFLKATSIATTLLVAVTVWAMVSNDASPGMAWLLGLSTAFTILALPFVYVAMGSTRAAEESRLLRAIRAALMDEEEKLPPMKKWDDD